MKKPKPKHKTWRELQDNRCPKCKAELQQGMFGDIIGCSCGFVIDKKTKDLLVNRDKNE